MLATSISQVMSTYASRPSSLAASSGSRGDVSLTCCDLPYHFRTIFRWSFLKGTMYQVLTITESNSTNAMTAAGDFYISQLTPDGNFWNKHVLWR